MSIETSSRLFDQPSKGFLDNSSTVYFSDGTESTEYREARLLQLQEARQRNLRVDPERAAFWFNALARPYSTTPAEVVEGLDSALAQIDAQMQAYMPIPVDAK